MSPNHPPRSRRPGSACTCFDLLNTLVTRLDLLAPTALPPGCCHRHPPPGCEPNHPGMSPNHPLHPGVSPNHHGVVVQDGSKSTCASFGLLNTLVTTSRPPGFCRVGRRGAAKKNKRKKSEKKIASGRNGNRNEQKRNKKGIRSLVAPPGVLVHAPFPIRNRPRTQGAVGI